MDDFAVNMDMEAWEESCRQSEKGPEHPYLEDLTERNLLYVERTAVEDRPKAKFDEYIQSQEDDQYENAVCDALSSVRQVIPLSPHVAINYLSAQPWWPNCETEYEEKDVPYNALLGVWHTDIVPWIRQSQMTPHELDSPENFYQWMVNQGTTYRLVFNMAEPPLSEVNYGENDPYALQPELHAHYNTIKEKATDMMEDFILNQEHLKQIPPERTSMSFWGFVVPEEVTINLMDGLTEHQVVDKLARQLAARLIMVHSHVPIVAIGPTAVFFRRCPFDPDNTSEIFFLMALTIAPFVDRALVVDNCADEKSASRLLDRMLDYASIIAHVPGYEVKDIPRHEVCMHQVIRYARDEVCPWCETPLKPLRDNSIQPSAEHLESLDVEVQLDRINDQRSSVRGSYDGESTLDDIVQKYEAAEKLGDPYKIQEKRDKLIQRLHKLYASYLSKPPHELLVASEQHYEVTWDEQCQVIEFWLKSRGYPPPPGAPDRQLHCNKPLRIRQ